MTSKCYSPNEEVKRLTSEELKLVKDAAKCFEAGDRVAGAAAAREFVQMREKRYQKLSELNPSSSNVESACKASESYFEKMEGIANYVAYTFAYYPQGLIELMDNANDSFYAFGDYQTRILSHACSDFDQVVARLSIETDPSKGIYFELRKCLML